MEPGSLLGTSQSSAGTEAAVLTTLQPIFSILVLAECHDGWRLLKGESHFKTLLPACPSSGLW